MSLIAKIAELTLKFASKKLKIIEDKTLSGIIKAINEHNATIDLSGLDESKRDMFRRIIYDFKPALDAIFANEEWFFGSIAVNIDSDDSDVIVIDVDNTTKRIYAGGHVIEVSIPTSGIKELFKFLMQEAQAIDNRAEIEE